MSNLISLSGLCKSYNMGSSTVEVLRGIDLEIEAGTTTALIGASGAGKSTLLHILGALDRPSSGSVSYKGEELFRRSEQQLADFRNRSIGFVFQFHHLLPEFTALENVLLPALINRQPRKDAEQQARQLLEQVGLGHRLQHRPGELSGGEQQRVAIARALVLGPELLLADEPTGNLDMKTSEAIHELLARLQQETGITLVVVTHNERLAAGMGRVVRLVDGSIDYAALEGV
ncbi:MAG: ABC transporter ATP-binding protein [Geobacter sp.]|uniref:ABC transporter ATP-binding protein n=1 Tax=Trichlorobacter sp. TaxID=2911007 RepID=UPI002A362569|nr:ABC transporter ATP-binding protein [Trichlorobacter sp.]MDY0385337.1 ABC transporter ATP-binding protein [Trichlorobacter sp.]